MDATAIAHMFAEKRNRIRIGIWITTAAAPLLAFYVAAVTYQVRRIAGPGSPLASAQTIAGSCLILEFIFPQLLWQTAAYRPERRAELVQMLNDVAWLIYVGVVGTAMVQMAIVAIAVLQDRRREPLLPRWTAYLSAWCAIGVSGGSVVVFTKEGPLAWNGLIAWYLLCVSFFAWMVTMTWGMHRASRRADAAGLGEMVSADAQRLTPGTSFSGA
ncbi:hypothetical protein ACFXG4_38155 [Nocardia sp. NPDC059246]